MHPSQHRQQVIVFDVNETLLDIEILSPFFARTFGDAQVMRQWFAELILYAQSLSLTGGYVPFGQLAVAVLRMVGTIRGVELSEPGIDEFKDHMARLPAHPDAAPALDMLRAAGFRMVTLTNSAPEAGMAVLANAGLSHYFEAQFSVDDVKRFKPAGEIYSNVASALRTKAAALRLVAAHTWDTQGALAAGWKAALVTRPGNAVLCVGEQPDMIEKDLLAIARQIIARDT